MSDTTFLKFLCVGVVNTLVGAGIMFCLYNIFHVSYWISSACNYIVGGMVSFFLNKHFTFQSRKKSVAHVLLFCGNLVLCYFIAYGLARPFVTWMGRTWEVSVRDNVSMLVGLCMYTVLNYIGQRFIFLERSKK